MTGAPIGGEWSGAIADAPSCHCLCAAAHPGVGICDLEAPRALLQMETAGSALGDEGIRDNLVCKPCAEATLAVHPRARGMVVLEAQTQDPDATH